MAELGMDFMNPVLADQKYWQNQQAQPAEIAQKAAATRYSNAMADRLETETAGEKRAASMLAQAAGSSPQTGGIGSTSSYLLDQAHTYAQAGMPTKAAALASQAAQAQAHESAALESDVKRKLQTFQLKTEMVQVATKLSVGVGDKSSWDNANDAFKKETGQDSPFAGMPYDPKFVKVLQDSLMSTYQKQSLSMRQTALQARLTNTASEISSRATRDNIAMERLRVSQQRDDNLRKVGGNDVGVPGKVEIQAASRLLNSSGLEGDEKDAAAFSIASEARDMRRKNPGMSADDALRQATLAAKQGGGIVPGRTPFIGKDTPARFLAPTERPPIALPKNGDTSTLTVGQHYKSNDGKVFQWTKEGTWAKPGAATKTVPSASTKNVSEDEEEDDEDEDA